MSIVSASFLNFREGLKLNCRVRITYLSAMVLFGFVFFISIIVIFFAQNPEDASTLPVEV